MYEHKTEPLAPRAKFYYRLLRNFLFALFILVISLGMGVVGYHYFGRLGWLDSIHNASMILSGMGLVDHVETVSGKWFSSFYSLFSGVIFITNVGIILAPAAHRLLHRLHAEEN